MWNCIFVLLNIFVSPAPNVCALSADGLESTII
uniref:Uncharacterized protein n=1 Tax=Arundo donax TaxID=35708 RepID=A0A0A9TN32_ARUDO